MKFLIGLVLISQLIAGAKDCSGRRDDCEETSDSAHQISITLGTIYNKNKLV